LPAREIDIDKTLLTYYLKKRLRRRHNRIYPPIIGAERK